MLKFESNKLRRDYEKIINCIYTAGGLPLLVGGSIRDALLGLAIEEIDLEVYNLSAEKLQLILEESFEIELVGKAFGVFKIKYTAVDIALPRTENKLGSGHKGFEILGDPHLDVKKALARRDFTMNAMAWNPITSELIDPYGGQHSLAEGILRHTSAQFIEDPLRVLRAMQFISRFNLKIHPETLSLCCKMTPETLPAERIRLEWEKWILKGKQLSLGLEFLKACGWVQYYPELQALIGCPKDFMTHSKRDVWTHTCLIMDAFVNLRQSNSLENLILGFAAMCHGFGKSNVNIPDIKDFKNEDIYATAGAALTVTFLNRMRIPHKIVKQVVSLVTNQTKPYTLYLDKAKIPAFKRLALEVTLKRLGQLTLANTCAQDNQVIYAQGAKWFLEKIQHPELQEHALKPIIQGRHLIDLGYTPSKQFNLILKHCFDAQIEGLFSTLKAGKLFLKQLILTMNDL